MSNFKKVLNILSENTTEATDTKWFIIDEINNDILGRYPSEIAANEDNKVLFNNKAKVVMFIKDRKTGKYYDPGKEFDKLLNDPETVKIMKNLKNI